MDANVDTVAIRQLENITKQRANEMQDAIVALRAAANQLAAEWTGTAGNAFQSAYGRWEQSIRPAQESLSAISEALGGAAMTFDSAEQAVTKAFS